MTGAEDAPRKRSCLRVFLKLFVSVLVLAILLAAAAAVTAFTVYHHVTREGIAGSKVRVTVPEGATGYEVGAILTEEGLIEHELLFRVAIRLDKSGRAIKHGRYDLPMGLSPMELLNVLYEGPNAPLSADEVPDELRVTMPEGLSIAQMAALFDNPEAFIDAASAPDLLERIGLDAPSLEGYLMPNTYFFDKKPTEREVVERMLDQFQHEYAALLAEFPAPPGFDRTQVVTLASLVEEEARVDDERETIAAVIYNRLKRNMALDLDCTLQYALGKYGERMLNEDKEVSSPYNTYKNAGLPPGPISNPGVASLRAALAPSDVSYLYFVSNADGETHTFSTTLSEHNRAVARYRREITEQRRKLQKEDHGTTD